MLYRLSYTHHKSGHILAKRDTLVNGNLPGFPESINGAPGRARTPDPRLRRPLLYPAELLAPVVGARGFEPPTPCSQGRCATRLRYAPTRTSCLAWPIPFCNQKSTFPTKKHYAIMRIYPQARRRFPAMPAKTGKDLPRPVQPGIQITTCRNKTRKTSAQKLFKLLFALIPGHFTPPKGRFPKPYPQTLWTSP